MNMIKPLLIRLVMIVSVLFMTSYAAVAADQAPEPEKPPIQI